MILKHPIVRLLGGLICDTFPHFAHFSTRLISHMTLCTFGIIVYINLCQQVSFEWCYGVFSPSFLSSQTPAGQCRFLPVKRESFLSTVATGTLRTGDWTEEKFRCNLLVSLARILFLNWLYMNELDYFEIN